MDGRLIIIGYGNPFRRDDGVAYHILNALRRLLGRRELTLEEDGLEELGAAVDTLMLHQLLPELAPELAGYARAIFVDAHAGAIPEAVRLAPVAEDYGFQAVTHHMSPGMVLALARVANGAVPQGSLVSVRGEDFDFGTELSPAGQAHAREAVRLIRELGGF